MLITRRSQISGEVHTLEVDCTEAQIELWQAGMKIQDAMPNVPAPLREFLMTGVTPTEWTDLFGKPKPVRKRRIRNFGKGGSRRRPI